MMSTVHGRWKLRTLSLGVLLIPATLGLSGCGGEKPPVTVDAEDAAATAERNKSMEEYMNSAEGKAATQTPK
jgi:hypothetical protein